MQKRLIRWLLKRVDWDRIIEKLLEKLEERANKTDNSLDDVLIGKLKDNKELLVKLAKEIKY